MCLLRFARILFWLALSLYLGGIVTLGIIVAPALAQTVRADHIVYPSLPAGLDMDRQTIGQLFGPLLYRFNYVEIICAGLMVIALALETWHGRPARVRSAEAPTSRAPSRLGLKLRSLLMLLILAMLAFDIFQLTPEVWQKRELWRTAVATNPAAAHGQLEDDFNSLHKHSEWLGHAKVYALFAMLIVSVWTSSNSQTSKLSNS